MPVFHTKTIESILEPVAQQVSKLVILHEEADDGNEMPDLSFPVQVVKRAADNLIKVGYETCQTSDDLVLRNEMPPALKRVEEACSALQEAAAILKQEPKSAIGKRNLIAGERGILQGVSAILLTFDESEVRKIIQVCKQVLEYLVITELIESMDDLVTYVKNLTPILTKMTREVDLREKELTHQVHRDLLCQHLEQVKNLTPSFISSIKIFVLISKSSSYTYNRNSLNNKNKQVAHNSVNPVRICVEQSKDYLIKRLSEEINEIIRILQLTTYDEDEWMSDDLTIMKQKLNNFEVKLKAAQDWLADENAVCGSAGEKLLRAAIDDANSIANRIESNSASNSIYNSTNTIKSLLDNLCDQIQDGKRKSVYAKQLASAVNSNLLTLHDQLNALTNAAQNYGITKPAPTIFGKVEQANKWCINPHFNDNGLGRQAVRLIIDEARKLAHQQKDPEIKEDLLKTTNECELLDNKLAKLIKDQQLNRNEQPNSISLNAINLGKQLQERLNSLSHKITKALIFQVAEDFVDINYPIKKLTDVVMSSSQSQTADSVDSQEKFERASNEFLNHTEKLCNTARQLASCTTHSRNKQTIELINELTNRILELSPQVVNAAYLVQSFPGNKGCVEHFELLQSQWQTNMERLQRLVDESLDCEMFIKACENLIIKDSFKTQTAILDNNNIGIVSNSINIARRSNRIVQVAGQEAENSEDSSYVERILIANDSLKQALPPMIQSAKILAQQSNNKDNYLLWTNSNEKLLDSIAKVREAVSTENSNDDASNRSSLKSASLAAVSETLNDNGDSSPASNNSSNTNHFNYENNYNDNFQLPDISPLTINEEPNNTSYIQPSKPYVSQYVSRPTPLPDVIEENESEFPLPQSNQPILMAAHDLHVNVNQWYSTDNDMVAVAKRITLLMARLSELVRGENGTKKDLISTAKQLADESLEITRLAKLLAQDCTDKRMRMNLIQVSERIPTIGTQLKILSTVKATMLGSQGSKEEEEATEMLIGNAQNLNLSVKATLQAAKSAAIKVKTDSGLKLRWIRKKNTNNKYR